MSPKKQRHGTAAASGEPAHKQPNPFDICASHATTLFQKASAGDEFAASQLLRLAWWATRFVDVLVDNNGAMIAKIGPTHNPTKNGFPTLIWWEKKKNQKRIEKLTGLGMRNPPPGLRDKGKADCEREEVMQMLWTVDAFRQGMKPDTPETIAIRKLPDFQKSTVSRYVKAMTKFFAGDKSIADPDSLAYKFANPTAKKGVRLRRMIQPANDQISNSSPSVIDKIGEEFLGRKIPAITASVAKLNRQAKAETRLTSPKSAPVRPSDVRAAFREKLERRLTTMAANLTDKSK